MIKDIKSENAEANVALLAATTVMFMLAFLLIIPGLAHAAPKGQTPKKSAPASSTWIKTITTFTNHQVSVIATSDGGSLMIGSKGENAKTGGLALWVMKSDQRGNKTWEKRFSAVKNSVNLGYAALGTSDGYLVTGRKDTLDSTKGGSPQVELWILKLAKNNGAVLWDKAYGIRWGDNAISSGEGRSIVQTDDGGIIVAGFGGPDGIVTAWLLGLDKNGDKQWEKFLGPADSSVSPVSVVKTTGGKIFVAFTAPDDRINLIHMELNGKIIWRKQLDQYQRSSLGTLSATDDSGFILAGGADGLGLLVKYDSSGFPTWHKTFRTNGISAKLSGVVEAADDRFVAIGGISDGTARLWSLQTDKQGTLLKEQERPNKNLGTGFAIDQSLDNGFYLAGRGTDVNKVWLMKTDQTGLLVKP